MSEFVQIKLLSPHTKMSNTSVYGVSVDSRSRNVDEPDNKYSVQLRRTMDRVKSVQLGSFQFQDARYAFDDAAQLKYSEPIVIPTGTVLQFVETTKVLTKATCALDVSERVITMAVPPTMNQITSMDDGTLVSTTAADHGLLFGVSFYPLVGLRMDLVGGDFPQDLHAFVTPSFPTNSVRPLLTTATIDTPYFTGNNTTFTWTTNYLDELTGSGATIMETRMIDTTGNSTPGLAYWRSSLPRSRKLYSR